MLYLYLFTLHIGGHSSIRNLRTRHDVVQGPTYHGHRHFETSKEIDFLASLENYLRMAMAAVCLLLFNVSSSTRRYCIPELFRLDTLRSFHLFLGPPMCSNANSYTNLGTCVIVRYE